MALNCQESPKCRKKSEELQPSKREIPMPEIDSETDIKCKVGLIYEYRKIVKTCPYIKRQEYIKYIQSFLGKSDLKDEILSQLIKEIR